MKLNLELLEHVNEVMKQWITDPEVNECVTQLTDMINEARREQRVVQKIEVAADDDVRINGLAIENNVDIQVNSELTLHLIHSPDGYIIDLYKYLAPEDATDEHDYDADFIDSIQVTNDQLDPEDL